MKIFKTILITACVFALFACRGSGDSEDVYITPHGKRYHQEWCRTIKGHKTKCVSVDKAERKGRTPCHVCYYD